MKVPSSKYQAPSYFKQLFTIHYAPPFPPLTKGGKRGGNDGFTLIELIMIIVVLAIAIPVLLIMLGQGAKQSVNAELEIAATNVGQALMEEIRSKCWDETATSVPNCGGIVTPSAIQTDAGEGGAGGRTFCTGNPNLYDDVDDYNGYSETCTWGGVSYTTGVQVCYVQAAVLDACVAGPTDYKRVQVTVTNATVGSTVLVTVMTNY